MISRTVLVVSRTTALVREVQAAAGPGIVTVHHTRAGDVEEFVELKGPFDLLVAGSVFDTRSGMERLRRLHLDNPELPILLALSTPLRSSIPDIVRVGAADLVELPAARRLLASAVRRSIFRPQAISAEVEEPLEEMPMLGEVISVASPSGGCGKTFYSTNLSYFLARSTGRRVCLVDLDLQFGEVTAALRLRPRYTMVDVVSHAEEDEADFDARIEEYLLNHESGFSVLPAPRHPAEADRITLPDVSRIVKALQRQFDYVVIDTSAQLSEVTITALELSTTLICISTVDLPSVRNMRVFVETLQRLNIPTDRITVILNKVEDDMGISIEEVDEALYHKVTSVLPYAREVIRSINHGQPVMLSDARSDISRKLETGMQARIGSGVDAVSEFTAPVEPERRGPFGATKWRLFERIGRKEDSK